MRKDGEKLIEINDISFLTDMSNEDASLIQGGVTGILSQTVGLIFPRVTDTICCNQIVDPKIPMDLENRLRR